MYVCMYVCTVCMYACMYSVLCMHVCIYVYMYAGHDFLEGSSNMVRGRTVPWNTLAIWKVGFLSLTGFPLIGDGTAEAREIGGVEVGTYCMYVCMYVLCMYVERVLYTIIG